MRKFTFILLGLLSAIGASAQLQNPALRHHKIPPGWPVVNESSGCAMQFGYTGEMQESGEPGGSFPSGSAYFDDTICGNLSQDRVTLTGPSIDLTGVTNAEVIVIYNLQVFGSKGEFIVEVYDGANWVQVCFQDTDTPRNTGANQTKIIDVSGYINNAFAARFIYDDEGVKAWGLGIDSYTLNNNSVAGIEEFVDLNFKYYPNPVTDMLHLNSKEEIDEINIYNFFGQEVLHEIPSNTSAFVDLSELPVGAYIAHIQIDNKRGSIKILKQ